MEKHTSTILGDHFDNFIAESVMKGRFRNASKVIRAGRKLLEEEEDKVLALKNAIQEGIDSGRAENFDSKKHLMILHDKRKSHFS